LQTGEGWNEMMKDTLRQKEVNFDCDNSPTYHSIMKNGGNPNGCGTPISYLFFVLFQLIVSIIFLNLFVAVILNGFTNSNEEEGIEVFKTLISQFRTIWQKYDPKATGFIDVYDFEKFITDLEEETEFITTVIKGNPKYMRSFISHLQMPTYDNFRSYYF
jgi:hypothetical protein